jgi:hypothetical protein
VSCVVEEGTNDNIGERGERINGTNVRRTAGSRAADSCTVGSPGGKAALQTAAPWVALPGSRAADSWTVGSPTGEQPRHGQLDRGQPSREQLRCGRLHGGKPTGDSCTGDWKQ